MPHEAFPCLSAHCKMCYLLDFVSILPQYIRLDSFVMDFFSCRFLETFSAKSVDHIIYRDYTVNWCSFISCSLVHMACTPRILSLFVKHTSSPVSFSKGTPVFADIQATVNEGAELHCDKVMQPWWPGNKVD